MVAATAAATTAVAVVGLFGGGRGFVFLGGRGGARICERQQMEAAHTEEWPDES